MEEILHPLIGSLSHYLQGFIHPRWCRISSIDSSNTLQCGYTCFASQQLEHQQTFTPDDFYSQETVYIHKKP